MSNKFVRTLYIDPELHIAIKYQLINDKKNKKEKIYKSIKELVVDMWRIFLNENLQLKGYRFIKGKILTTPDMNKTTIAFPNELNEKIEIFLSQFDVAEARAEDKSFSLITNELLQRIYLNQEL